MMIVATCIMLGYVMIDFMMNDDLVTVVEVLRTL